MFSRRRTIVEITIAGKSKFNLGQSVRGQPILRILLAKEGYSQYTGLDFENFSYRKQAPTNLPTLQMR
jgi:hypothetical protein